VSSDHGELWQRLAALPAPDRLAALTEAVTAEFKTALLMARNDDLPATGNLFDLGLTSQRAVEARERLQAALGCEIGISELFERPCVRDLVAALARGPVADLFSASAAGSAAPSVRAPAPAPSPTQAPPQAPEPAPDRIALPLPADLRTALQERLDQLRRG
jgi:aryl carrier-like protein